VLPKLLPAIVTDVPAAPDVGDRLLIVGPPDWDCSVPTE
jgi:hypothetical protein